MDERERQSFHNEANRIAREANIRIKALEGKAFNTKKQAMLIPPSTPGPLRDASVPRQSSYVRQIAYEKRTALNAIEEVIKQMPPDATDRDKGLVRGEAYDHLGGRENILREKAAQMQRGYEASSSSHQQTAGRETGQMPMQETKEAHPPSRTGPPTFTDRLKGSQFLKEMPQKADATKGIPEQTRVPPPGMTARLKGAQILAGRTQDADKSRESPRTPGEAPFTARLKGSAFLSPEHLARAQAMRQQRTPGLDREV